MRKRSFHVIVMLLSIIFVITATSYSIIQLNESKNNLHLLNKPGRTAKEIIEQIKDFTNVQWSEETVDLIIAGNPDAVVTGIATTFMATMDVLKEAVNQDINFIITHEPTFYNHLDEVEHYEGDLVVEEKLRFIDEHGLVIWRFHDHIHRMQPDRIVSGMVKGLGWEKYLVKGENRVFTLPETTLKKLAEELSDHYGVSTVRVIGDPNLEINCAGLMVGCPGYMSQVKMFQREDIDVMIIGESREWETVEYVRDACSLGTKKGMIILGHVISEEDGMKYLVDELRVVFPEMNVRFIPAGNPFWAGK